MDTLDPSIGNFLNIRKHQILGHFHEESFEEFPPGYCVMDYKIIWFLLDPDKVMVCYLKLELKSTAFHT